MTDLTNADLSRLITCVVIHDGVNPYGLHRDTFDRLAKHGLVMAHYAEDEPDCPESYEITDLGREVVEAALGRAREHLRGIEDVRAIFAKARDGALAKLLGRESSPNPAPPEKTT